MEARSLSKRFAAGALFGGVFLFVCISLPALAQFTCTTTPADITCTNSGTAGAETNTASGAGQNATTINSGAVNGTILTQTNNGGNATTSNSGTVSGDMETLTGNGGNAIAVNSGAVNGLIATFTWNGGNATTFNYGTVNKGIFTQTFGGGNAIAVNSGVVSNSGVGSIAFQTSAWSGGNATTINSGTVSNPGQTAIQLDGNNTTLTILPGSFIVGGIKLGGASNTVNIRERNVDLTFDSLAHANVTGTVPYVVSGNRIVSVDPTSFGFTDRALMDFTHALSGFLSSAPAGEPSGFKDGNAASFTGANGVTAWAKGFYGQRVQPAEGIALRGVTGLSGGAMGFDGSALLDLRIGAFAGGGAISSSIASNAGSAKSDIGFGGLYGRYNAGAAFLDAALTVGGLSNSTVRANINNNMAANGPETAKASFGGWFAEPEAALGYRYVLQDGWSLTPALKLRYLRAGIDGYTETGSAANLTVGARVPQDLEERAELTLARTLKFDSGTDLHVSAHGGVLGLERVGGTAVSGTLLGQGLGFAAPGKDSVAGGYGGLDLDLRIGEQLSLFGAGEYTATNDQGSLVTAKGGLRWRF